MNIILFLYRAFFVVDSSCFFHCVCSSFWDGCIKSAIDENMAHCYGPKHIKLDDYIGYCSSQMLVISSLSLSATVASILLNYLLSRKMFSFFVKKNGALQCFENKTMTIAKYRKTLNGKSSIGTTILNDFQTFSFNGYFSWSNRLIIQRKMCSLKKTDDRDDANSERKN